MYQVAAQNMPRIKGLQFGCSGTGLSVANTHTLLVNVLKLPVDWRNMADLTVGP